MKLDNVKLEQFMQAMRENLNAGITVERIIDSEFDKQDLVGFVFRKGKYGSACKFSIKSLNEDYITPTQVVEFVNKQFV